MDRGYYNLLSHLNRPSTTLPLPTIQASIAHYLAHVHPSPTPFVALIISSPLFTNINTTKSPSPSPSLSLSPSHLQALSTAFRHGVHLKVKLLQDKPAGLFSRSFKARLEEWVGAVVRGLMGGEAVVRLACCSGLLLALEDWEREREMRIGIGMRESRGRRRVEEEWVVALAEVLELYANTTRGEVGGWEREFKPVVKEGNPLTIAFLVCCHAAPLVASTRLRAAPLRSLCYSLLSVIDHAFCSGNFLAGASTAITLNADGKVSISPTSPFTNQIQSLSSSPLLSSMAPLSRMYALCLSILSESNPREGWVVMWETGRRLEWCARAVEGGWGGVGMGLSGEEDGEDGDGVEEESKEVATKVWGILKTLLFTNIMIIQSILTTVTYVPQPSTSTSTSTSTSSSTPNSTSTFHLTTNSQPPPAPSPQTPSNLALTALQTFSHLSFILPQFGGVTPTAVGGLPQLKKVFYTALDILGVDGVESGRFVRGLGAVVEKTRALPERLYYAKKAYALACVEQLVPVLDDATVEVCVFPMCSPHLSDPSHRETYKAAHSVMLAIFASHANKANDIGNKDQNSQEESQDQESTGSFCERVIPFYVRCLLENSGDGKLNTVQLRLAYAALVRSAGSFTGLTTSISQGQGRDESSTSSTSISSPSSGSGSGLGSSATLGSPGDTFAWYCITSLLEYIHALRSHTQNPVTTINTTSPSSSSSSSSSSSLSAAEAEHIHRLRLTLIACVPSVSLVLLPRLLDEIRREVKATVGLSENGEGCQENGEGRQDNRTDDQDNGNDNQENGKGRRRGEEKGKERRKELVHALFKEILENVGDQEKEFAIRWWDEYKYDLVGDGDHPPQAEVAGAEAGEQGQEQRNMDTAAAGLGLVSRL